MSSSGGSAAAGDAKATTKKAAGGDTDDGGSLLSVASIVRVALIAFAASAAWQIRMYAINDYGRVIHEFDPWFNFRATQVRGAQWRRADSLFRQHPAGHACGGAARSPLSTPSSAARQPKPVTPVTIL